jgi:hypothetical protein
MEHFFFKNTVVNGTFLVGVNDDVNVDFYLSKYHNRPVSIYIGDETK